MPGRGKASGGRGRGASTSSTSVTRKRKAEGQAEKEEELAKQHEGGDKEGDAGQEDETGTKKWQAPGESEWDDVLPTSLSTPEQFAVVVPLGTKRKIWAGGFVNMSNFLPKNDDESMEKLELVNGQLVKKLNVRKVTNKDDWTSAFIRYMAVYCDKNPTKTWPYCAILILCAWLLTSLGA